QRGGRAAPQPELVLLAPGGEPARAPLDDEGGELVPVYLEEHHVDVSEAAVGDPHLSAVDQVMRSVFREASHRLRTEGIRTAAGFAQRVSRHLPAGGKVRQVSRLLRGRPEEGDGQRADAGVRAERGCPGTVACL